MAVFTISLVSMLSYLPVDGLSNLTEHPVELTGNMCK